MSLRFFTMVALSLRKRRDLDLRPARIHSTYRPRSFAFHVVAKEQALTPSAGRQRCGRLRSVVHPLPAGPRRLEMRQDGRLRYAGCDPLASFFRCLQTGVSVKRHLSRIRPCLTRPLARCLSRARRHGAALLRTPCALRVSAFRKSFVQRTQKDFPNLPKKRRLALGAGHLTSLRAGVSRVRTGQIQTGEKQWHSTKTNRL